MKFDKNAVKQRWLALIDHFGEDYINTQLGRGRKISTLRKDLEISLEAHHSRQARSAPNQK